MQTEITSAQKDKMVDLDVSGEGAEIELEDKSHGSVKPETYENVKTEEKDPLEPKVELQDEQSDEMDQYSDKVKKRIDKMTWKLREAEREREAALQFAQNVQKELSDAKKKTYDIDKGYMSESEVRNKMAADLARQNLIAAREAGDYQKEEEARQALTKLDLEAERIRVTKTKKEREYEEFQKQLEQEQQAYAQQPQQARPQPSQKALAWAENNPWFRSDEEMTDYAQRIHRGLVAEGFDTESDDYYDELTNRVRNKFPESFSKGSDQTTRSNKIAQPVASASRSATSGRKSVKLTPSQVKIANKLGVPLAEYAKYV
jgi:hypothetical protein